ncbi:hypothetical protein BC629DRAFT_1530580, partial [Irpex lacteus]
MSPSASNFIYWPSFLLHCVPYDREPVLSHFISSYLSPYPFPRVSPAPLRPSLSFMLLFCLGCVVFFCSPAECSIADVPGACF